MADVQDEDPKMEAEPDNGSAPATEKTESHTAEPRDWRALHAALEDVGRAARGSPAERDADTMTTAEAFSIDEPAAPARVVVADATDRLARAQAEQPRHAQTTSGICVGITPWRNARALLRCALKGARNGVMLMLLCALLGLFKAKPLDEATVLAEAAHCPPDLTQPALFAYWALAEIAFAPLGFSLDVVGALARNFAPASIATDWTPGDEARAARIVEASLSACDALRGNDGERLRPPAGTPPMGAVSLAGGGHKVTQYFGQWYYLLTNGLLDERTQLFGCSTGAPIAAMLVLSASKPRDEALRTLREVARTVIKLELETSANELRLFVGGRAFELWPRCARQLAKHLPADDEGARALRGKLHVALTRPFSPAPSWLFSDWQSAAELKAALSAGGLIPYHLQDLPFVSLRQHAIVDGGFANLKPKPLEASVGGRPVVVAYNDQAAAIWTRQPLLAALYSAWRITSPLKRDDDFVADIRNGYLEMHRTLHARSNSSTAVGAAADAAHRRHWEAEQQPERRTMHLPLDIGM